MIKFNAVIPTTVVSPAIDLEPTDEEFLEDFAAEPAISDAVVAAPEEKAGPPLEKHEPPLAEKPPTETGHPWMEGSKNLLKHIPGEASGFYLMAVDSIPNPGLGAIGFIFVLALVLLILVRYLAGASRGIMISTILAFLIWMFVLDSGLFHVAFPNLLPDPFGLIVAFFYSMVVTLLANAGKIQ